MLLCPRAVVRPVSYSTGNGDSVFSSRGSCAPRPLSPAVSATGWWRRLVLALPHRGSCHWADFSETWLPGKATIDKVYPAAVLPAALAGWCPGDDSPVKLSAVCAWFDSTHGFDEIVQAGYPPEKRPIPKADYTLVHQAVVQAVARGKSGSSSGMTAYLARSRPSCNLIPMQVSCVHLRNCGQ